MVNPLVQRHHPATQRLLAAQDARRNAASLQRKKQPTLLVRSRALNNPHIIGEQHRRHSTYKYWRTFVDRSRLKVWINGFDNHRIFGVAIKFWMWVEIEFSI
jgi:hypothetical protein